jgi:hypothetical protein
MKTENLHQANTKNQRVTQKTSKKILVLAIFGIKKTPITRVFIPVTDRKF